MSEAELERTNVKISASTHQETFTANGEVITFEGFLTLQWPKRVRDVPYGRDSHLRPEPRRVDRQ